MTTDRLTDADLAALVLETQASRGPSDDKLYVTSSKPLNPKDWGVVISDVDCTPRPRYRETAAQFEARMGVLGQELAAIKRENAIKNRQAALQPPVMVRDVAHYFTQCACGWCGLQVADPELARREYDAHACGITGDTTVERAMAETGRGVLTKRTSQQVRPSSVRAQVDVAETPSVKQDEAEARFALLELK